MLPAVVMVPNWFFLWKIVKTGELFVWEIKKGGKNEDKISDLGVAVVGGVLQCCEKNIALQYGGHATAMQTPGDGLTIEVELG